MGRSNPRPVPDDAATGLLDALRGLPVLCPIADLKVAVGLNGELAPLLALAEAEGLVEADREHVTLSPLGAHRLGVSLDATSSRWVSIKCVDFPLDRHHPGPMLESEVARDGSFSLDSRPDPDAIDPVEIAMAAEEEIVSQGLTFSEPPEKDGKFSTFFEPADQVPGPGTWNTLTENCQGVPARGPWKDHRAPDRIDLYTFLYTGADPCWTPDRETKDPGHLDAPAGSCALCGGDEDAATIPRGSHRVCGRCMRSGSDRHSAAAKGLKDADNLPVAAEPGYVTRNGVTVPERFSRLLKG
jgi:hypothetical protein